MERCAKSRIPECLVVDLRCCCCGNPHQHLFHALANVNGTQVPGKTAPHLRGANVPFGGKEVVVRDDYAILCWK